MAERRPLVLIDGTPRELPSGDMLPEDPTLLKEADIGSSVCAQGDARLSNSREWTAATVTQAEAEAGTATTRRAWTAQRVFQAIAAWWNVSAAKSKLDGIATGATANATDAQLRDRSTHTGTQAVSTITGLGGAATLNVGTAAGTVCAGNDARLSDARTPTSHTHGNLTNAGAIGSTANLPVITTTSGVLTTGSFGTTANTFCQGNDARLSDARTPTAHTHGNLTNAGAIGSTSGVPLITGASGVIQAGAFGSTAGTFCQGNDSRLSDARTPTAHTHPASNISDSTPAGRTLLTAADAAAQRTALDLVKQTDAADRTEGRIARIDLIPMDPFQEVCHIAGMQPTLYLDFARQDFRHYSPATGLREKALSDIVTFTRTSDATYFDALGVLRTAGSNVPRLDFDPVTGGCKGLLIEESRTNLLTYSQEFDNAVVWANTDTTVIANAVVAPDGTLTGDKLVESTNNGPHLFSQTFAASASTTYAWSVYLKAAERFSGRLRISDNAVFLGNLFFNLTTATVTTAGSVTSPSIVSVGNGWYRVSCVASLTASATSTAFRFFLYDETGTDTYTGDGTSGLYIWGAQVEAGAFPTSYIPTSGSQVTRAADLTVIDGTAFSDFYRHDEFSVVLYFRSNSFATLPPFTVFSLNRASSQDIIAFELNPTADTARAIRRKDGGGISSTYSQVITGGVTSLAGAMTDSETAISSNGTSVVVGNADQKPISTRITQLSLNYRYSNYGFMNGTIKTCVYFPKRLSNAQLQQLSALGV